MPTLSIDTIQKLCTSTNTYTRGCAYATQQRVRFHTPLSDSESSFSAVVRGSHGNSYRLSVALAGHPPSIESLECSCPAFHEYQGICKHLVAALLQLNCFFSKEEMPYVKRPAFSLAAETEQTSMAGRLLLEAFSAHAMQQAETALATGDIRLVPELHIESDTPYLTLSVGRDRLYLIRNAKKFVEAFTTGEFVVYGKHLSFVHNAAQFDAPSRALLALLQAHVFDAPAKVYYGEALSYNTVQRAVILSPTQLDALIELVADAPLACVLPQAESPVRVVHSTPRLNLVLDATEKGGYQISLQHAVYALFGLRHIYLASGETLFCCDEAFSADTAGFWRAIQRSASGRQMLFSAKDMPSVCRTALPVLRNYFAVQELCVLDAVTPPPLCAALYLDTDAEGDVLGNLEFSYDTEKFSAFAPAQRRVDADVARETLLRETVQRYFDEIKPEGTAVLHSEHEDRLLLLADTGVSTLSALCDIYASDSFKTIKIRPPITASIGVRLESGLLQLEMDLGDFDLDELDHVLSAYRKNKRYYRLGDGSFLNLQSTVMSELSQLTQGLNLSAKELAQGNASVSSYYTLYLNELLKKSRTLTYDRDKNFREIVRNIHNVQEADFELPPSLKSVLRGYQCDGYRWIRTLGNYGFGGILADDMGLGKTLQVLAVLIAQQSVAEPRTPSLVVCPSSLVLNWCSEAERFAPELRVAAVQGTAPVRAQTILDCAQADLIVTSYDSLKRDIAQYESIRFLYVVADEAQYLKNQNTQNARAVKALSAQYRLALTGTPVENSLAELWSIFDFLMPGYLYHYSQFRTRFEQPIVRQNDAEASRRLQEMVAPFLLRRMKKEVLHELPDKIETVLCADLTDKQRKLYAATALKAQQLLASETLTGGAGKLQLLAILTQLRQLCCDPSLVYQGDPVGSAKLELCLDLIHDCLHAEHRILLFSQFTTMLDILAARLDAAGIDYFMLTGATKPADRLTLVNAFNTGRTPVFLISLKAGGTGLNLTGADTVIHYDPWWNVSAQNQASDRAYRIGQTKQVQVYKLIASGTIEERILHLQQRKSELADLVISENDSAFARLSQDQLAALFAAD